MRPLLILSAVSVAILATLSTWFFMSRSPAPVNAAQPQVIVAQASVPAPAADAASPQAPAAANQPIQADSTDGSFRVCNQTGNPVSIAFGYRAERGWQSEGWWVAGPGECQTVYNGRLDARYYYVYAADDIGGGSWDGQVYMCTRDETFTIFGVEDCLARGYERTGFFEVDTQNRSNWMLQLTEPSASGATVSAGDEDVPMEDGIGPDDEGAAD
ncbi:DUF1036 domain-containing protein [Devosia enhydra]|uniref:DUF1036 domain-containing protein n=1 Tax=Devosia enhydra TaxID=665118 RepID=UPI000930DBCA|nr:DUF1036 domain-containing protein [Devosia enhydra]